MTTSLLRSLLRCLPAEYADKVYFHLLRERAQQFKEAFYRAPLRFCPSIRMNLNPSDTMHGHLALAGVYEPELSRLFLKLSGEGGLLVDVGANFGYFSLLWCGLGKENRSIAFEASPKVLPHIRENIAINDLAGRIDLRELAASNTAGTLCFDLGPAEQTGWGGISKSMQGGDVVEVRSVRLDSELAGQEIALLKIDCEGADFLVLQGAEKLLKEKKIKSICFEENLLRMKLLGIEPGSAAQYVRSLGYQCREFGNGTEFHAWI
jgi:FkbM family methyltransferase